jgi:predicted transcriptional regulator
MYAAKKEQGPNQSSNSRPMPGASKIRIVYQVNLNFKTVKEHLDLLLEKGLLEAIPGENIIYRTTEKGERALESHKAVEAIYS